MNSDNEYSVVSVGPIGEHFTEAKNMTLEDASSLAEMCLKRGRVEFIGIIHPDHEGWVQVG